MQTQLLIKNCRCPENSQFDSLCAAPPTKNTSAASKGADSLIALCEKWRKKKKKRPNFHGDAVTVSGGCFCIFCISLPVFPLFVVSRCCLVIFTSVLLSVLRLIVLTCVPLLSCINSFCLPFSTLHCCFPLVSLWFASALWISVERSSVVRFNYRLPLNTSFSFEMWLLAPLRTLVIEFLFSILYEKTFPSPCPTLITAENIDIKLPLCGTFKLAITQAYNLVSA